MTTLSEFSEEKRAEISVRVGKLLSSDTLAPADLEAGLQLAREIVDDTVLRVRVAFAEAVKTSRFFPKDLAVKLAIDADAVACPFLQATEIFDEDDWVDLVARLSRAALAAVARRTRVPAALADKIFDLGDAEIAAILASNEGLSLDGASGLKLIRQYQNSSLVLEKLAFRSDLDGALVLILVPKIALAARKNLEQRYGLPDFTHVVVSEAETSVIIDLIAASSGEALTACLHQLRKQRRLTEQFLLAALRRRALTVFQVALSLLADTGEEKAAQVVSTGGNDEVRKLLLKAKVSTPFHDPIWVALLRIRKSETDGR